MKKKRIYIIAEVGPNHNGSFKLAQKMIAQIAKTGVDAIKFQLGDPDKVYCLDAFKANYQKITDKSKSIIEMSKRIQLKRQDHIKLAKLCKKNKVTYLCSAFDLDSLIFLDKKINIPLFKIPSGEINSIDMINYIAKKKKRVLLSTGMASFKEIKNTINKLKKHGNKDITIMHCVSSYPAEKRYLNLNVIDTIKEKFDQEVGYSDHSLGDEASLAAVAKGAKIIEKHVTISRKFNGPDHKSSMTILELKNLVKKIRILELILGSRRKNFSKDEKNVQKVARKSLVSARELKKNTIIKKSDILFKRPGTGISPNDFNKIIGKKIKRTIKNNRLIMLKNIK
jgi:N,N'-diacetyllegionaminate synthase